MGPVTAKILIGVGLKVASPVLTALKSKLEKDFFIYKILRKYDAIKIKPDFDSIYLETLYQLISVQNKDKGIISLFELEEVRQGFKDEIYEKNNWSFKINLDLNLHTNASLRKLKQVDVNLSDEIEIFKSEFEKVINTTREPKEIEEFETLNKIKSDVSDLIDIKKLNEKFRTEVEINSQIIFSKSEIQPLSDHISNREELVSSLIEKFATAIWIAINGSVSTGKTQLSVLLSKKTDSSKYWINLRELTTSNFLVKIFSDLSSFLSVPNIQELDSWQSSIFEKLEEGALIVLDDLPKLDHRSQSFSRFISFLKTCKEKNIKILSTSNFTLPSNIKEFLKDDFIYNTTIPYLEIGDVNEILLTYIIDEEIAKGFNKLIHSISSGHPIIIKAICEYLIQKNWILSSNELSEIFRGNYSLELNEDTYEILSKTITDESTRNLLYRLNIVIGTFTIDDVRIVGTSSPIIPNSIEKFNSTIGMWIQKRDTYSYEVSPLLKRLKSRDLSPQLEQQINHSLGKSILDKRKLNQFDANKAVIYFVSAKSFNEAGFVLTLVLNEALKNPKLYFEWGFNLYWYSTPLPKEMDLLLQMYIRTLQILLNKQENNDITYLIAELENICSLASKRGINVGSGYLLLSSHYSTINSQKALKYLMSGNDQENVLFQDLGSNDALNLHKNFEAIIWGGVLDINSIEGVENWLETISKLTEEQLNSLKKSDNIDFGSSFIFRKLKENEEKKSRESQDWNKIIQIFKRIQLKARALNLDLIQANGIKYIINILSEKLNAIDQAYEYAMSNLDTLSKNQLAQFLVNDAIGRQLFYNKRIEKATPFIANAVNIEIGSFYTEKLDTYLVMSQILGIEDSKVALHFSNKAKEFVFENEFTSDILQSKVIGELAISLFLNNDIQGAIYELEKGYQVLLDSYNINTEYHITIMRYGHALNYWHHLLLEGYPPEKDMLGGDYEIPFRGMFLSNVKEDLVEEYYFPERRFMVSYIFFRSFESLYDFALARKWAFNNISVHNDFDFNYFAALNSHAIPYLILDKKYFEVIELQISIIDNTNKLNSDKIDLERLSKNKFLKNILDGRPKTGIKEYDAVLIEHILIPIILNYIMTHSNSNDDLRENLADLENVLQNLRLYIQDTSFVDSFKEIVVNISLGGDPVNNILKIGEEYKGEFDSPLKVIGYLFASFFSVNLEAFKLHFAVINRLDTIIKKISKGAYYFILIPFFEKFWFSRIENNGISNLDFWLNKSQPYYESTEIENKVKCLFRILVHHLNYKTSNREDEWLDS